MLLTDTAIEKCEDDGLDRHLVAENFAKAIDAYDKKDSFVIGIQGQWGDGKTSFINMALEKLPSPEKFLVVKFNPWYFTGDHQILRQFCAILSQALDKPEASESIKEAAKLIRRISSVIKPLTPVLNLALPRAGIFVNGVCEHAKEFADNLTDSFQPSENITDIKIKIEEALKGFDKKILVVIDDIDRLSESEIYEVFRMVKIIGDFPHTIYLLSYDKKKVSESLKNKGCGEKFIDKIVQHEFDVPQISKFRLQGFFDRSINEILGNFEYPATEEDNNDYRSLVSSGLMTKIENMRDAKRVLNKVYFDYGCVKGEVNFFDFLAVCVLQIHAPEVYEFLAREGKSALEHCFYGLSEEVHNQYDKFKRDLPLSDERWDTRLLEHIFPILTKTKRPQNPVSEKRLCSAGHFEKYFLLTLPKDTISELEYERIIKAAGDYKLLHSAIKAYQEIPQQRILLSGLRERTQLFAADHISTAIAVFLDLADFGKISSSDTVFVMAQDLMMGAQKQIREQIFEQAIKTSKTSVCSLLKFVDWAGQKHGYSQLVGESTVLPEGKKYLTRESYDAAYSVCLDRLAKADPDTLLSSSQFGSMLIILKNNNSPALPVLRDRLLETKDGFLKIVHHLGANNVYFVWIRRLMGYEKNDEEIVSDIRAAMKDSSDAELTKQIEEKLKNRKDQSKIRKFLDDEDIRAAIALKEDKAA
jgi:predicted KAP-like P-loop ATPase